MKVVFLGTPTFAARTLDFLLANGVDVVAVVTQPPRPKGRSKKPIPSPVADLARAHNLPLLEPEKASTPEVCALLATYDADLFVVVAYGEILRKNLRDIPHKAIINVHPSLLPKYRGAAPIQRAIMNGETETGVTIMHVIKELDAGDILAQESLPIGPDTTFSELEPQLCDLGCRLLLSTIRRLPAGTAQDAAKATYAPKIESSDRLLDFSLPAQTLHNTVRAIGGYCPVRLGDKTLRLKVLKSKVVTTPTGLSVPCATDYLQLLIVQLEGKKPMSADDLLRGLQEKIHFAV